MLEQVMQSLINMVILNC